MLSLCTRLPARLENGVTWHHIVSFNPSQNTYLKTLNKGSRVYVEANYELRDPDPNADPSSPSGQRQIFLRHGALLLSRRSASSQLFCRGHPGTNYTVPTRHGNVNRSSVTLPYSPFTFLCIDWLMTCLYSIILLRLPYMVQISCSSSNDERGRNCCDAKSPAQPFSW